MHRRGCRLATKIGLQLIYRLSQVFLAHDVIPIKNASRLMASKFHGYRLRGASSTQVANRSSSEIMNQQTGETRVLASRRPGLLEITDRSSFLVKHVATVQPSILESPVKDFQNLASNEGTVLYHTANISSRLGFFGFIWFHSQRICTASLLVNLRTVWRVVRSGRDSTENFLVCTSMWRNREPSQAALPPPVMLVRSYHPWDDRQGQPRDDRDLANSNQL